MLNMFNTPAPPQHRPHCVAWRGVASSVRSALGRRCCDGAGVLNSISVGRDGRRATPPFPQGQKVAHGHVHVHCAHLHAWASEAREQAAAPPGGGGGQASSGLGLPPPACAPRPPPPPGRLADLDLHPHCPALPFEDYAGAGAGAQAGGAGAGPSGPQAAGAAQAQAQGGLAASPRPRMMLKLKDYPPAGEFYNVLLGHYAVSGWGPPGCAVLCCVLRAVINPGGALICSLHTVLPT